MRKKYEVKSICLNCGQEFITYTYNPGTEAKYCSPECRKITYKNRKHVNQPGKELIGRTFYEWKILDVFTKNEATYVKAQCSCGTIKDVLFTNIKQGKSKSCGHRVYGEGSRAINEVGNTYGHLTVLHLTPYEELTPAQQQDKSLYWTCQCDCGSIINVKGTSLRNHHTQSCGCVSSKGEEKIANLLTENGYKFKREVSFFNVRSNKGKLLRFDFAIYDNKDNLIELLEYDGIQHFEPGHFNQTEEEYQESKERDDIKKIFCYNKGIKLKRISYQQLDNLTITDLF